MERHADSAGLIFLSVADATALLAGAPLHSLICKSGSGKPFYAGSSYKGVVDGEGQLACGMNEQPAPLARRVKSLAQTSKTSTSRVIADLIESGLDAREQEKKRFFECADQLSRSRDPAAQKRLKEELARMTFGD